MEELAKVLPQTIIYIVMGFAYLTPYHYVALKQNTDNIEHSLISSLVVGFIYCNIAYMIPFSISYEIDLIVMFITASILGYLTGRLLNSKWLLQAFEFLKIRDTVNKYYWDDLMDKDYPMKVSVHYDNKIYTGMLHLFESYSNSPHLILTSYIVKDNDGIPLEDNLQNTKKVCVIDSSKANLVEIIYNEKSYVCTELDILRRWNPDNKKKK